MKRGVWCVWAAILGVPLGGGAQAPADACPLPVPVPDAPSLTPGGVPAPAWDLRCIELFPAALGGDARGVIQIRRPPSPFGVSVDPDGFHLHDLEVRVDGLPDPASLGPYTTYMAWVTPLTLDPVLPLGTITNGSTSLGTVDFARYMILISAEASPEVTERDGPLVLRGRSPSSRMEAHDLLSTAPAAEEGMGMEGMGGDSATAAAGAGHDHHGGAVQADGWAMAPGYPGVPMLPGIMELRPRVDPLRVEAPPGVDPPRARPREEVALPDGGTLDLTADLVRQTIAGRELVMLAFNGQHPGPLIRVAANTTIFVNFTNNTPFHTAVHWHGIRLENRFDGVPGITQDPVLPGETFQYRIHFPDAGLYWYHPHHREDVQQELGLSGNLLVDPPEPGAFGPANQEQVLMLDDILLDGEGVVPFGAGAANYAMMGRFGNTMLVNGSPSWSMAARPGEVVRFYLTNAANTRTFNLSFRRADPGAGEAAAEPTDLAGRAGAAPPPEHADHIDHGAGSDPHPGAVGSGGAGTGPPLRMKVVASDVGRFEREEWVESVVLAPAERYVVDVLFPDEGTYVLGNHVMGINHRQGAFRSEVSAMGTVEVAGTAAEPDHGEAFGELRTHADVSAEIDRFRPHFHRPVDHELVLGVRETGVPHVIHDAMLYDWVFFNPVEWAGTMPMMNWVVSADDVTWTLREPSTGRENEAISWRFQVGDVVKIRIHNDRGAFHAMQHPIHIHGQRFLVLEQDGVPTQNLVWKDTVLLPVGSTTDILLELSNPGRWMLHCHISEHLEAEMQFIFDVEARDP